MLFYIKITSHGGYSIINHKINKSIYKKSYEKIHIINCITELYLQIIKKIKILITLNEILLINKKY